MTAGTSHDNAGHNAERHDDSGTGQHQINDRRLSRCPHVNERQVMSSIALVAPGHNKIDYIKQQIAAGYNRANKGGEEWIEGSLIAAAALREGRELIPSNVTFGEWLKQNNLAFYSRHDREALIHLASDLDLMRTVLGESDSRSYQRIWGTNKSRFPSARETHVSKGKRKPRTYNMNRATIHRTMKLGEAAIAKIKGTSLDRADEIDELIRLNHAMPPGELKPEVQKLIDDAAAGKDVSALAHTATHHHGRPKLAAASLVAMWKKRMVYAWQHADLNAKTELMDYLVKTFDDEQREDLLSFLIDNNIKAEATK
jgi:hypothetical protein